MKTTYLLTNLITGDTYVGCTGDKNGLKMRLVHHKSRAKLGKHNHLPLYENINTYGWENFYPQVLCEGDEEEYYVWLMQPTLNGTKGGRGGHGPSSEKTNQLISEGNRKSVRCVETGEVFERMMDAAEFAGVSGGMITMAVQGKRKSAGGYHWEWV